MANSELAARAAELRSQIHFHNYRYHVLDSPLITDAEFDRLLRELQEIEREHPELRTPDSPTLRVGGVPAEKFTKVRHPTPVLSLGNAFDADGVRAWWERIRKLLPEGAPIAFVVEPKIDGLTVVLHYRDGVLVQGATRGDGEARNSGRGHAGNSSTAECPRMLWAGWPTPSRSQASGDRIAPSAATAPEWHASSSALLSFTPAPYHNGTNLGKWASGDANPTVSPPGER